MDNRVRNSLIRSMVMALAIIALNSYALAGDPPPSLGTGGPAAPSMPTEVGSRPGQSFVAANGVRWTSEASSGWIWTNPAGERVRVVDMRLVDGANRPTNLVRTILRLNGTILVTLEDFEVGNNHIRWNRYKNRWEYKGVSGWHPARPVRTCPGGGSNVSPAPVVIYALRRFSVFGMSW